MKILVAIDISADEARQVIKKASQFIHSAEDTLTLVHVVEPVMADSSFDLISSIPTEIEQSLRKRAEKFLQEVAEEMDIKPSASLVKTGSVKSEVLVTAKELGAELIVIGTHGRHGLGLLLGSTASSILHGTQCDVYVVRIKAPD